MTALLNFLKKYAYGLMMPALLAILFVIFAKQSWFQQQEYVASDFLFGLRKKDQERKKSGDVLLVAIDQQSIDALGGMPWPRNVHADLFYLLQEDYFPKVVAFDVLFSDERKGPTGKEDRTFVDSLQYVDRVVLAGYAQNKKDLKYLKDLGSQMGSKTDLGMTRPIETVFGDVMQIPGADNVDRVLAPLPTLRASAHTGFTDTAELVGDNVRRLLPMVVRIEDLVYPSFATQVLIQYWGIKPEDVIVRLGEEIIFKTWSGEISVPIDEKGEYLVNYHPRDHFEKVSYRELTKKLYAAREEGGRLSEDEVRIDDRMLVIAVTEPGIIEFAGSPMESNTWPVVSYLSAIENILQQDYLKVYPEVYALIGFLLASWLTLLFLRDKSIGFTLGVPIVFVASYIWLAIYLFLEHNILLQIFWPISGFVLLHSGAFIIHWVEEFNSKQHLKGIFASYISPGVMEELLSSPENIKLGGVSKPVTILFSDIRGFTTISEGISEEQLVTHLNEYFEKMVECVIKTQGTLHKYIGDAIMAVWGDVLDHSPERNAQNAVRASLAMREELRKLNQIWREQNRLPFRIGIGLNHGKVLVGNIGATQRREFTVIGDAVNLASRLEGVTKQYQTDFAIGESVKELLNGEFVTRSLGNLKVKGKTRAVRVYEVVGISEEVDDQKKEWIERYEDGFLYFVEGKFERSYEILDKCLKENPRDFCAMTYTQHSKKYMKDPPEEWDGSIELTSK